MTRILRPCAVRVFIPLLVAVVGIAPASAAPSLAKSAEPTPIAEHSAALYSAAGVSGSLEAFSDPAEHWGPGIEAVIERAYRQCFRTYVIDGRILTLRMPFAQNNERAELAGTELEIVGKGKASPAPLWEEIDGLLGSVDFRSYVNLLGDGREKVIIFDLPSRQWSVSRDLFDVAGMKAGSYRGLPHRPYVLSAGEGVQDTDVYNYLYSVGRVGMDCSGFVWHILSTVADAGGLDLGEALSATLGVRPGKDASFYVGTAFFDSRSREVEQVDDGIGNLLAGDVLLFRGRDGRAAHSAVVQSVDLDSGVIRYLQSTDEAPARERGAHDSYIRFDPSEPHLSLKDPSLEWSQRRFPPFPGEVSSGYSDDGQRYRAYPELGGGKVVRLKALEAPIRRINADAGR